LQKNILVPGEIPLAARSHRFFVHWRLRASCALFHPGRLCAWASAFVLQHAGHEPNAPLRRQADAPLRLPRNNAQVDRPLTGVAWYPEVTDPIH